MWPARGPSQSALGLHVSEARAPAYAAPAAASITAQWASAPMPAVELTSYLEQNVQKRLESVNGVGEVFMFGARRRQVQVKIDPDRLNAYQLSTSDVAAALRAQNLELPGGRLEQGTRELSVRTVGRLSRPDEFAGDILGDLSSRRGRVVGTDPVGTGKTLVRATTPEAEVVRYAIDLRSMTRGKGSFARRFSHYEELPSHMAAKVIEEVNARK